MNTENIEWVKILKHRIPKIFYNSGTPILCTELPENEEIDFGKLSGALPPKLPNGWGKLSVWNQEGIQLIVAMPATAKNFFNNIFYQKQNMIPKKIILVLLEDGSAHLALGGRDGELVHPFPKKCSGKHKEILNELANWQIKVLEILDIEEPIAGLKKFLTVET